MRKFVLSITVIVAFFLYSLFVHQQNQTDAILSPTPSSSTPTPTFSDPSSTSFPTQATPQTNGKYKNGTYTGGVADAFYGNIQVRATITNGTLTDVTFLQYPNDRRTSIEINSQAMPMLKSEAISAQSANVDIISGATDSSQAFIQSLSSALNQAK
jgi:uncharacterized protein with FMN-binding domain